MAPPIPLAAVLPERVLPVMVAVPPKFSMPPPVSCSRFVLLPERVLFVTFRVPPITLAMPPPALALLFSKELFVTFTTPVPKL